jgi:hypothetical protein
MKWWCLDPYRKRRLDKTGMGSAFLLVMRGTFDHRYPKSRKCYRSNLRCDNQPTLSSGRAASQQLVTAVSRTSSWSRAACFVVPAA